MFGNIFVCVCSLPFLYLLAIQLFSVVWHRVLFSVSLWISSFSVEASHLRCCPSVEFCFSCVNFVNSRFLIVPLCLSVLLRADAFLLPRSVSHLFFFFGLTIFPCDLATPHSPYSNSHHTEKGFTTRLPDSEFYKIKFRRGKTIRNSRKIIFLIS